jgi:hypothetical protein
VTGIGIGEAAQWVTVILFLEIAKRSFTSLRRQEIFLLTYVASQLIVRAETGTFLQLIWRQYFVGSQEAVRFGLQQKLVNLKFMGYGWFAPSPDSEAIIERTFFHIDWVLPIALLVISIIVARVTWFTSGYVLFRLVSDREQLPFPTAPQAALASMALAEESGSEEQTWRWPCFLIGSTIGLVFGLIYVGVPALTEVFAGEKVTILPIPFAGVLLFMTTSPLLHHFGFMPRWIPGMGAVQTQIAAGVDFWQLIRHGRHPGRCHKQPGVTVEAAVALEAAGQLDTPVRRQLFGLDPMKGPNGYKRLAQHNGSLTDCMFKGVRPPVMGEKVK